MECAEHAHYCPQETKQRRKSDNGVEHPEVAIYAGRFSQYGLLDPVGKPLEVVIQVVLGGGCQHLSRWQIPAVIR